MRVNAFIWQNYKDSEQGKAAINLFEKTDPDIFERYLSEYFLSIEDICSVVVELYQNSDFDISESHDEEAAYQIFQKLVHEGIVFSDEDGQQYDEVKPDFTWYMDYIVPISTWLYKLNPYYFKPYFFIHNARLLMQIADGFGIELPEMPAKRDKQARFEYYWAMCSTIRRFEQENGFTPAETCAFLYDFCPKYFDKSDSGEVALPQPTQAWFIGTNKIDFDFLDNFNRHSSHFWQGNLETRRGDILVMYCLSPRSYIHSVWRAETGGIASPFFHWYSSIHICEGQTVSPVSLNQLKEDSYFKQNKLVKKNFQGVNGYPLSAEDYRHLLDLIEKNGGNIQQLPQLFAPEYQGNQNLKNEKDVETNLIEPFLKDIDGRQHWVRQLTVKMGRGEKVYPDYALLTQTQKGYEQAAVLLEAKFHIRNHQDLEAAFKQVWSYGLRLSADLLIIADKNAVWLYEKAEQGFDRNRYSKFFWKDLQDPKQFHAVQHIMRRYLPKQHSS